MLDKTIPYKNIIMRAESFSPSFFCSLPEGFRIKPYEPGDETQWASIETAVGEFDTETEAREYFVKVYLPYQDEIRRRCFFVLSPEGEYVGTCTAWFLSGESGETGVLHWFGVRPKYQGLGLGKALLNKTMRFFEEANAYPVYLHTQTWSHKAIWLYIAAGFCLLKKATFAESPNDYNEAMEVLKEAVPQERLQNWMVCAK